MANRAALDDLDRPPGSRTLTATEAIALLDGARIANARLNDGGRPGPPRPARPRPLARGRHARGPIDALRRPPTSRGVDAAHGPRPGARASTPTPSSPSSGSQRRGHRRRRLTPTRDPTVDEGRTCIDERATSGPSSAPSRDFVDSDVRPVVRDLEHANTYPEELIEQMKQLGIYGLVVPEEFGGTPVSHPCFVAGHRGAGPRLDEPGRRDGRSHRRGQAAPAVRHRRAEASATCPAWPPARSGPRWP